MKYESIALSGLPGSGKSTLARSLSSLYGWPVHSVGKIFKEQWKREKPKITFEEYWVLTDMERNRQIEELSREIVETGRVIADQRFITQFTDLPCLLVYVMADLNLRVERNIANGRYQGTQEQISELLLKREEHELNMYHQLYGETDFRDPSNYHLTLNAGKLTLDEEARIITSLLE